jgi:hypothetical protein
VTVKEATVAAKAATVKVVAKEATVANAKPAEV